MKSITLSIATSLLVLLLLTSAGHFASTSFAQGNQTNQSGSGGQQNQTGIGTASQMENLTSGNTGLLQNGSDIGGQNTMNRTGEAGQATLNKTGEALTNASKSDVVQNISKGAQEIGQKVANETGDILGSASEGLKGLGGGSQSK
jgi:hypothetical protein